MAQALQHGAAAFLARLPPARAGGRAGSAPQLLRLLAGSDDPAADRGALLKANIVFWLLGATDGHAKNASVFLRPGGRFGLTPFYDVLSAQPAVDAGQLRRDRFRLSMAVGNNRHYAVDSVFRRHFGQTALAAGIGSSITAAILDELIATVPLALEEVLAGLPMGFPGALATSVRDGVLFRLSRLDL